MLQKLQLVLAGRSYYLNKLAIELSHLIGFESTALEFPLVVFETSGEKDILYFVLEETETGYFVEATGNAVVIRIASDEDSARQAYEHVLCHFSQLTGHFQGSSRKSTQSSFVSSTDHPKPLPPFDSRPKKGLESLFDKDYVLLDHDGDLLPDQVNLRILLQEGYSKEQVAAACHVAARLGLETTVISYPITCGPEETPRNLLVLEEHSECILVLESAKSASQPDHFPVREDGRRRFVLYGSGEDLMAFSNALCGAFPLQSPGSRWTDVLDEMTAGLAMQTVDGQLAWLEGNRDRITDSTICFFSPKIELVEEVVKATYQPAIFKSHKGLKTVHEQEYQIDWEVDICKALLDEKLWRRVRPGDRVKIRAVLSEDRPCREKLAAKLCSIGESLQAQPDIEVICAYKQGFSWLEEVVMPCLSKLESIDSIQIAFKPFLPEGIKVWQDEDGATPSYSRGMDDENKWLDLPIRYLQELYPIDDILAAGLKISRDKIEFVEYKGECDITYEVKAVSGGSLHYTNTYKAAYAERGYLDAFPGMGKVHPGTGRLQAWINDEQIVSERIRTDVEAVWDIYQEDILPWARAHCDRKAAGKPKASLQPFFAQLRLDLSVSEPDERLSCREDMISSLDALHEDFYFAGTDFFKAYGLSVAGEAFDAPGLILPVIKKREGPPSFKFTLLDMHGQEPFIDFGDDLLCCSTAKRDIHLYIEKLFWSKGKINPLIRIEAPKPVESVVESYGKLLDAHKLSIEERLRGVSRIHFSTGDGETARTCAAEISEAREIVKDLRIEDIDISENALIGYDRYMAVVQQLKRVPGISVYRMAESYQGRDIYAVELLPDYKGYVSRTKLINRNPVEIINARHHANEVSSTNAALMLLRELLTQDEFRGLANDLNLVIVPMENVDGAAIHYELQKDNPYWKLHIARFNAIGKEFYYEHFNDDTIHTEAHGFTRLWRRWLPDVIIDNHGVPSHEWEQQFSGYTSPSFKGFWLPRSLLYGYFWTVNGESYAGNILAAKRIEEIVADCIAADAEIESINREWQERFEKYAHKWMPRLFPADYYKNMINYWIPFDYDGAHRYPSVRFPWITSVAYTSEVADETAQDGYLGLCARAHMLHDIAIIRALRDSKCVYKEEINKADEKVTKTCIRCRPVIL